MIENALPGGAYRVMVGEAPTGEGPPMHVHPDTDEGFYVGEGELPSSLPTERSSRAPARSSSFHAASNTQRASPGRCAGC